MGRATALVLLLLASAAAAGELPAVTGYRLPNGSLYFGDSPPPGAVAIATLPAETVSGQTGVASEWRRSPAEVERAARRRAEASARREAREAEESREKESALAARARRLESEREQPPTVVIFGDPPRRRSALFGDGRSALFDR